jgi:hypothetical protein
MTHHYRIAGLTVASDLKLPGARVAEAVETSDVSMRMASVPQALDDAATVTPHWEADETRFLFKAPGVARFLLSAGRQIDVELEPDGVLSDAAAYLQGSVFGALLHQRGALVMHASAVAVGDGAVLFCGPSGHGKSTTAATLGERGYPMLGDDVCAIVFDSDGTPMARADARQYKLAAGAIDVLALGERQGAAVLHNETKFYVEPSASALARDLPVLAVYVIEKVGADDETSIRPMQPADALRALTRNAYRPGMIRRLGLSGRYFEGCAKIVRHAKVFALAPRRDLLFLSDTAARLEVQWREIGLVGPAASRIDKE